MVPKNPAWREGFRGLPDSIIVELLKVLSLKAIVEWHVDHGGGDLHAWEVDDSGQTITASHKQPLFHVEHGVGGTENAPLNTWRIVHLASDEDGALAKHFELMSQVSGLPEYVERYVEDVLKVPLKPKPPQS